MALHIRRSHDSISTMGFHNSDSGSYYDDGTVIVSDLGESNDYTWSDGVYSFDYAESHKVRT